MKELRDLYYSINWKSKDGLVRNSYKELLELKLSKTTIKNLIENLKKYKED